MVSFSSVCKAFTCVWSAPEAASKTARGGNGVAVGVGEGMAVGVVVAVGTGVKDGTTVGMTVLQAESSRLRQVIKVAQTMYRRRGFKINVPAMRLARIVLQGRRIETLRRKIHWGIIMP
jgi:glycine cleavage system aminomethyltransferase T